MSEREQIVARLAELQAKQEAATGWGAAVGAREEEIRSLESRLLRIDAMTAPPSTETPRHTATLLPCPFCGGTNVHALAHLDWVACDDCGASLEDAEPSARELWNTRADSHAALTAKVAELEAALQEISSWKDDTLGARPKKPHPYNCVPEITEAFDRGARMAFYRCAERARGAMS